MEIDAAPGTAVVISRDLGSLLTQALPGILAGGVGGVAIVAGTIMLVVRARRRRRANAPYPAPPGYYPDPYRPGAARWWNGTHWAP